MRRARGEGSTSASVGNPLVQVAIQLHSTATFCSAMQKTLENSLYSVSDALWACC